MNDQPHDNQAPQAGGQGHSPASSESSQNAAAEVARHQANHAYQSSENPYNRTHQENFDWRKYHSAWQEYYAEYYRRYYHQLHSSQPAQGQTITGSDPAGVAHVQPKDLKNEVREQVKKHATSVRRSHHFWPIVSAIAVAAAFLFVQFNSVVFAQVRSYISPGALEGQNKAVVDPNSAVTVGAEPRLIIPKINVDMPVNYDVSSLDENTIQMALRDAAVQYNLPGANAKPGQFGNVSILGHSSNDVFAAGKYKFAFVLSDQLIAGDTFYLHYKGTRYTYKVTDKKVINPNQLDALQIGEDKPMATIITCTPPGTSLKRLLIFGEQISPDPKAATKTETPNTPPAKTELIPGNAPTLFEQFMKIFF